MPRRKRAEHPTPRAAEVLPSGPPNGFGGHRVHDLVELDSLPVLIPAGVSFFDAAGHLLVGLPVVSREDFRIRERADQKAAPVRSRAVWWGSF